MSYGVTPEGYVLKPQSQINSEAETDLTNVADPVTGSTLQVNFDDPSDIIAMILAIILEGVGDGLLVDQAAYNQFNPTAATGDALSTLVVINGLTRRDATNSTVLLDFTGTPLATIPASTGVEVTDINQSNVWLVEEDITFDGSGDAMNITATCQTAGAITALATTLTFLVFSVADLSTVTNPSDATAGRDEETDAQLRQRRDRSTEAPAIGTPGSIFSVLSNLPGVVVARVYNNVENTTDANGLPPKSMAAVVVGGDDDQIADVLLARNNTGLTVGNTTVDKTDVQGETISINFFRPTQIPIYIIVEIIIVEADIYPSNGDELIKDNIVLYAENGAQAIGVSEGFDTMGFPPGTDILVSRLYTPINSVPGHNIIDVFIGTSPTPTLSDDIPIAFDEVGEFLKANIIVNDLTPPTTNEVKDGVI